jgi:hypothetical protein
MILKNSIFFLMITVAANSLFAANLFSNSGFETATTGWTLSFHDPRDTTRANAKESTDTAGAMFGKKYLKINVTAVDGDSAVAHNWWIQLWEPAWTPKNNVEFTYSFWAKSGDTASHMIHIAAMGDSASEYTYISGTSFTLTSDWQLCQHKNTWTNIGTTKKHFRLFLGESKGVVCFDSMALDTASSTIARKPLATLNRNEKINFNVELLPNTMRIVIENPSAISNNISIYSVDGRLLSSNNIPASVSTFEMKKPAPGAWVVDINSNKKVIQISK